MSDTAPPTARRHQPPAEKSPLVTLPRPKKPLIAADRDETGVPLSSLDAGSRATVLAVDVSTSQGRRLCDLGFMPETEVRVVRRAPLGDPIIFYLRGGQICLRRAEAERIRVCALGPADEP